MGYGNNDNKFINISNDKSSEIVYVKDFGAKGDWNGTTGTDDTQAIKDAFLDAKNNKRRKIEFEPKTYFIKNADTIKIYNSVNFNGANFVIDDKVGTSLPLFQVTHDTPMTLVSQAILDTVKTKFVKSTKRIPELAGNGNAILHIYDNTKKMYIREGENANTGDDKFDQITIDNNGYITSKLIWDFDNVTALYIQKMDDNFVTIENANFASTNDVAGAGGSPYTQRNILINRSNVILSKISHKFLSDGTNLAPRSGFIYASSCANVLFENINIAPLTTQADGTYDIGGNRVIGITLDNVRGQTFVDANEKWGVMGANYLKEVIVRNSSMSRIDSHKSMFNLTVDNCVIGANGITVVGFGDLILKDTKFYGLTAVSLRPDYGSFWDGNIYIDNVMQQPSVGGSPQLISGTIKRDWNYGFPIMMGTGTISVKNFTFDARFTTANPLIIKITTSDGYDTIEKSRYRLASSIKVESARIINKQLVKQGFNIFGGSDWSRIYAQKPGALLKDGGFMANISVDLDDIDFQSMITTSDNGGVFWNTGFTNKGFDASDDYASDLERLFYKIHVANSENVFANLKGMYVDFTADNVTLRSLICVNNGSRSFQRISNSKIYPAVNSFSQVNFYVKKENAFFSNCTFGSGYYENNVSVTSLYHLTAYDFIKLGTVGSTASIEANLSSCVLEPSIDLVALRADINDTNFVFGNNHYAQKFTLKKGTTAQRPAGNDVKLHTMYTDNTLNKPIWVKSVGVKEVDRLAINSAGTTIAGDVIVTLNGVSKSIPVLAGDTGAIISDKIRATNFPGWTTSGSAGAAVIFTKDTVGTNTTPAFSVGTTNLSSGTFTVTTPGENVKWMDYTGAEV